MTKLQKRVPKVNICRNGCIAGYFCLRYVRRYAEFLFGFEKSLVYVVVITSGKYRYFLYRYEHLVRPHAAVNKAQERCVLFYQHAVHCTFWHFINIYAQVTVFHERLYLAGAAAFHEYSYAIAAANPFGKPLDISQFCVDACLAVERGCLEHQSVTPVEDG